MSLGRSLIGQISRWADLALADLTWGSSHTGRARTRPTSHWADLALGSFRIGRISHWVDLALGRSPCTRRCACVCVCVCACVWVGVGVSISVKLIWALRRGWEELSLQPIYNSVLYFYTGQYCISTQISIVFLHKSVLHFYTSQYCISTQVSVCVKICQSHVSLLTGLKDRNECMCAYTVLFFPSVVDFSFCSWLSDSDFHSAIG